MNAFDQRLKETTEFFPLTAHKIDTLQVNMSYKCNLSCMHCHIEASPSRTENMSSVTVDKIIDVLHRHDEISTIDITGGSPEYNSNYKRLIKSASDYGKKVIVRTNLAILSETGMEDIPDIWTENKVKVVASLPCYTAEGVDGQRGRGTYDKAISALNHLNKRGYGSANTGLEIDLMFNPAREGIAPDQHMLEEAYRQKLNELHGITFNHLIALSNMPIGRLGKSMTSTAKKEYVRQLQEKFNPSTIENLMCRHLISIAPDGYLYDCDFWQALKLTVKNRSSNDIDSFDYTSLSNREIITSPLCFMCTAGAGASCGGALT